MQMDREQRHFPWRWLQVAGMGLQGQKKLLVSSFTLQIGWDQPTQTMEEGSAGENSIPPGGVLGEMEKAAVLKQLAPPTC